MRSERIRRTVKRRKPVAVELLRREIRRLEAKANAFHDSAQKVTPWKFWHGRHSGMCAAYLMAAERLKRILDKLTEKAT